MQRIFNQCVQSSSIRNDIFCEFGIDIDQTDNYRKIILWDIFNRYRPDIQFSPNFERNGSDSTIHNNIPTELKTRYGRLIKNGSCGKGSYAFHVEGDMNHPSYIFATFDKDRSNIVHHVLIVCGDKNSKFINTKIHENKKKYFERNGRIKKNDVISINESDIFDNISFTKECYDGTIIYYDR